MKTKLLTALLTTLLAPVLAQAYPLFGSEDRGIGRVEQARLVEVGKVKGRKKISGELLSIEQVDLRLLNHKELEIPPIDKAFTAKIRKKLTSNPSRYGIAVLDLSNLKNPRYAEIRGKEPQNPGSVGKIAVATAVFQALADVYPNDIKKRMAILHDTMITADEFIKWDHHNVRMWDSEKQKLTRRPLKQGDKASFWTYMDWMMSASSNAAAAMCMKQAMLIDHFGKRYPVSDEEAAAFFKETPKNDLRDLLTKTLQGSLERNGIDLKQFRQGSFFTRTGKIKVPGTNSYATARELMNYMLRMEQGKIVDEFSSREIKRLLYITERRIRYASSPALRDSAVYFKSGSLYSCYEEEGFKCKKYHGNRKNYMNSIAIVESPAGDYHHYYMSALLSNVLRKNSAVDHQTLATRIHRIIQKQNPVEEPVIEKKQESGNQ